ncbi:hypothetical protein ASPCAL07733 [Aspergillus calidoustus]|uniref:Uncharacterized protein n=1 Tax=Aspergillus calidoustus TaxID=454130 RepID=A0A0U5GRH7_ASPCI|nr:hypothetical protein ASPCAL07733 [Aspergillus calidoustus]
MPTLSLQTNRVSAFRSMPPRHLKPSISSYFVFAYPLRAPEPARWLFHVVVFVASYERVSPRIPVTSRLNGPRRIFQPTTHGPGAQNPTINNASGLMGQGRPGTRSRFGPK